MKIIIEKNIYNFFIGVRCTNLCKCEGCKNTNLHTHNYSAENLNKVFSNGERRYNPTILSKSYELILEKIWRVNWNQNTNYMVMLDEEELLSKLIFIEEI